MERSTPESRAGTVGPRASLGSAASRSPRLVPAGKWTSPPKAKVTACPFPSQSGSRRGFPACGGGALVMVARPAVALPGGRRVPGPAVQHEDQDERQHHESETHPPGAAIALDPPGDQTGDLARQRVQHRHGACEQVGRGRADTLGIAEGTESGVIKEIDCLDSYFYGGEHALGSFGLRHPDPHACRTRDLRPLHPGPPPGHRCRGPAQERGLHPVPLPLPTSPATICPPAWA